jgi:large subunit ribosomal protein L10
MPSLINELAVRQLRHLVDGSTSVILIDPLHLKAEESLGLRRELHDVGAQMQVAKARLIRRVLPEEVGSYLQDQGALGIIGTGDIAAAAKVVNRLSQEEKIIIRAGLVEGRVVDGRAASRLADLPSKPELQSKLLGVLCGVALSFVRILNAPRQQLVLLVEAYRRKQAGE